MAQEAATEASVKEPKRYAMICSWPARTITLLDSKTGKLVARLQALDCDAETFVRAREHWLEFADEALSMETAS